MANVTLVSAPVPIGLGFGTALGLSLGLWGLDLGLALDNCFNKYHLVPHIWEEDPRPEVWSRRDHGPRAFGA